MAAGTLDLGNLLAHIRADNTQFDRTLKQSELMLDRTAKKMMGLGSRMTAFVSAPLVGLGGLFVKLASDTDEITSKFNVTFRNVGEQATKAFQELDRAYGLNAI